MNSPKKLVIIVPCYNEEEILPRTNNILTDILKKMIEDKLVSTDSYICYVNDGSKDNSWNLILDYINENKLVKGLSFSKNYGHQSAMLAGLSQCEADMYITIDADLQDDPNAIVDMVQKHYDGAEIVYGVRKSRDTDSFFKRNTAKLFYKIMRFFGSQTIENSAEYRLISKKIVDNIKNKYKEKNLYLRGIITDIGYKYDTVCYDRNPRIAGTTKYTFSKMLSTAINGLTTSSTKIFDIVIYIALSLLTIAAILFILVIASIFLKFYTTVLLIMFLIFFVSAIQLFVMSILAEYISKIYIEVRGRPLYIISEDYTK